MCGNETHCLHGRRAAGLPVVTADELARLSTEDLSGWAVEIRDAGCARRITYSPNVFIPLTRLCRNRCGYCTFVSVPARIEAPYLTASEVLTIGRRGAALGCHEALFTLGEMPEDRWPQAADWLWSHGWESTIDYLIAMCRLVLDKTGLLPHVNAGALGVSDLLRLREVAPSQGMMIETLAGRLHAISGPHYLSPDKTPERRLATLEAAGEAQIPFTTGILVGIGETFEERIAALQAIADSHRRHGHVQEVIIQNFLPKPGTAMHRVDAVRREDLFRTVAAARLVLPPEVHLQAPPNLVDDAGFLLDAGIDDWGGVSAITADYVNPERPWPTLVHLAALTEGHGCTLAQRLPVHPCYVSDLERWIDPALHFCVRKHADSEGLAREDHWYAGADVSVPEQFLRQRGRTCERLLSSVKIREVLDGICMGQEVTEDELVTLFGARGPDIEAVCALADELRAAAVGDVITYVVNRNINYTNVCTYKCRFCGFSKGPYSLELRQKPYLLTLADIEEQVRQAAAAGATEVCLQGGIHPDFDGDYYVEVTRAVRRAAPDMHVHGFSALEVAEGARRLGIPLGEYLERLKDAGLGTLPGTAAEILDDEVRAVICPGKVTTNEWLEVHETAHLLGLRSNVTIMFGHVESPRSWARHLVVTRALQKRTGGFTEFVPLPFVHMATPIYAQRKSRPGPTFREALLMHAIGRIAYVGLIDSVQTSWVKMGRDGAQAALSAGANDVGGTLMGESISRAAGGVHGQESTPEDFACLAATLGRKVRERTTLYGTP